MARLYQILLIIVVDAARDCECLSSTRWRGLRGVPIYPRGGMEGGTVPDELENCRCSWISEVLGGVGASL